jgi:hypothetical protein
VDAAAGLHAGFLIGAKHILVIGERLAVSDARARAALTAKSGSRGKIHEPVLPWLDRVLREPAAHRRR